MNPLIAAAAKNVPFSPMEFTWFDFTSLLKSHEKMFDMFRNKSIKDFVENGNIENVPMPFERIACVMKSGDATYFSVTIERSNSRLVFSFWATYLKHPAAICTYDDSVYSAVLTTFDPEFERRMIASGNKSYQKTHVETVGLLLWSVIGISIGAASDSVRTAYKCTNNPKNPQRIKRGKTPLFEWETVLISPSSNKASTYLGGSHSSPKPHDRRGHQRRYKSGKVVYIRPTTINKHKIATEGFIHHDYKVTA